MLDEVTISRAIIDTYLNKFKAALQLDVAIVGGGPSGLVAGYYLAAAGKKTALFDRRLSIGGAVAAMNGADFLCYVTPAEHLRLPTAADVVEGVIASRIAAHAADLAKGLPAAWERDRAMSRARKALDWEEQIALAIHPAKARAYREASAIGGRDVCTMCGEFCAIKRLQQFQGWRWVPMPQVAPWFLGRPARGRF